MYRTEWARAHGKDPGPRPRAEARAGPGLPSP